MAMSIGLNLPMQPPCRVRQQSETAARGVISLEEHTENVDSQNHESKANHSFRNAVHSVRQRQLEEDHGASQKRNSGGVSQGIQQAEVHGPSRRILHAGDIGNGGDVVVVKTMAKTKDGRREQSELQTGRSHCRQIISLTVPANRFSADVALKKSVAIRCTTRSTASATPGERGAPI